MCYVPICVIGFNYNFLFKKEKKKIEMFTLLY